MWHWLGQMPAYQARRWALIYFNTAVWFAVGGGSMFSGMGLIKETLLSETHRPTNGRCV